MAFFYAGQVMHFSSPFTVFLIYHKHAGIFIAAFLIPEGVWQLVTILGVCVVFLIPCFYALKLEVSVGAYKCQNCGYEIVPTYKEAMMAMHRGFTRHLKCPKCNQRTWCKKVLKK